MPVTESQVPKPTVSRPVAGIRLLVGLVQGLALYGIYQAGETGAWNADNSGLFAALLMVLVISPVLLVSGLGHLPATTLWRWLLPAAAVLALLGFYDIWRGAGAPYWDTPKHADAARYPSPQLWLHAVAGFLIAHAMVWAAAKDGRRVAGYRTYFECASKLLIQIAFAAVFTGIVWLVLLLGAALFDMIKLAFLKDMLDESWFAIPVSTFAFAYALHITDVRPAIVQGVRGLVLVLLSWILPVAVLLIGGFLLALPFTGLEPLWATKTATALLLAASALLVVLVNAAFQDGSVAEQTALPIRLSARLAAILVLPLAMIAAYALGLRVGQYGWTVDRLVAAFSLAVALCCGAGYFWAAFGNSRWLSRIAPVNILCAFILLFLLLAIFSPALDPARISVNSQLARLESGKVPAQEFDFEYLRFSGQRFGNEALREMAARKTGKDATVVVLKARAALENGEPWNKRPQKIDRRLLALDINVRTPGTALPESFLAQDWREAVKDKAWRYPQCLYNSGKPCDAYILDLDSDANVEVLLRQDTGALYVFTVRNGVWLHAGNFEIPYNCGTIDDELRKGLIDTAPARFKDLVIAGQQYRLSKAGLKNCPSSGKRTAK